jgi:hypothetical protein
MTSSAITSVNDNERMDPTHPRADGPQQGAAHAHNFASTRTVLWDRIAAWLPH